MNNRPVQQPAPRMHLPNGITVHHRPTSQSRLAVIMVTTLAFFGPAACRSTPKVAAAVDPPPSQRPKVESAADAIKVIQVGGASEKGLVWLFPGIEGGGWMLGEVVRALRDAGVEGEMRILDWYRPFGALANLQDRDANHRRATQVAEQLVDFRKNHPTVPIDLVGYSGGAGLAVLVLEALPANFLIRHVVLAQPALSPDYDLTPALRHVSGGLTNFYSPYDGLTLGWGTRLFGTIDRKYVASAGKDGFDLDKAVSDLELRSRVQQYAWSREWLSTGHYGLHVCIVFYQWNRTYVAPALSGGARQ